MKKKISKRNDIFIYFSYSIAIHIQLQLFHYRDRTFKFSMFVYYSTICYNVKKCFRLYTEKTYLKLWTLTMLVEFFRFVYRFNDCKCKLFMIARLTMTPFMSCTWWLEIKLKKVTNIEKNVDIIVKHKILHALDWQPWTTKKTAK